MQLALGRSPQDEHRPNIYKLSAVRVALVPKACTLFVQLSVSLYLLTVRHRQARLVLHERRRGRDQIVRSP